ncbi:MAG: PEP-CTERM sorting domain-containing protein [Akkermansiaceae bacterium]
MAPTLNWDAGLDTDGNNSWESSVNSAGNTSFSFPNGAQSPTDVSGSSNFPGVLNDFAGGDTTGLGGLGGGSLTGIDNSVVGSTFTNFNGDIAALRYYNRELSLAEVQQNFDTLTVPEPSSSLFALLASGFLLGRRKR